MKRSGHRCFVASRACFGGLLVLVALLQACGPQIPKDALVLQEPTLQIRQRQARKYTTQDERKLLVAANQTLQDLGYNLQSSNKPLGLLVASKNRTAVDAGQAAGQIMAALILGVYVPIDKEQMIRASVVTLPTDDKSAVLVRVTFQRLVWNDTGALWKLERLDNQELYVEFHGKLSKAMFLEAQEIDS